MIPITSSVKLPVPNSEVPFGWSRGSRLLFRFIVSYSLFYWAPVNWLNVFPGLSIVSDYYLEGETWLVTQGNRYLFHIKDRLVPLGGSGDTSYGYAQLSTYTLLALMITLLWSLFDRRRHYRELTYWFLVVVRYAVATVAISYGSMKVLLVQMPFPLLSELATPVGDLLPMRLSWLFIGYSAPYQFFSGVAEMLAGILLLWRRTAMLGALLASGVFLNVVMLNLSYDIPVKLFAIHLLVYSGILVTGDSKRLLDFFVHNRPTQPKQFRVFTSRRERIGWIMLKLVFIGAYGLLPFYTIYQDNQKYAAEYAGRPKVKAGFYEVTEFRTIKPLPDSLRWQNLVFETNPWGSIKTADTLFRQRYRRGYFGYVLDSIRQTITFKYRIQDSLSLFTLRLSQPDTNRILLRGLFRGDSLHVALRRREKPFQLADRPFHWLSESNR